MKTILAALLAGTFLISLPAFAGDKAPAPAGEKAEKGKKAKSDKGDKAEKAEKPAGGGW